MFTPSEIFTDLQRRTGDQVFFQKPLAPLTTFRIGGPAQWFVSPTASTLPQWIQAAVKLQIPFTLLGNGSNVLIPDEGLPGLVLWTGKMNRLRFQDDLIETEAGVPLPALARFAARHGWAGYEFLAGIPGTVGGGIVMNAGTSPSHQICQLLHSVEVVTPEGKTLTLFPQRLGASYRETFLRRLPWTVVRATFQCVGRDAPQKIAQRIADHLEERRAKQPLDALSAGSVFKNPRPDLPAWRLIRDAGLAGKRIGDAVVSPKHANWILNLGQATARDVQGLIQLIQEKVLAIFQIQLDPEIIIFSRSSSGLSF